jgi:transcriptional regulator with XRE-family HTH domain
MSSAAQVGYANDSWQTARNARTLRAFMALRNTEIAARIRQLRSDRGDPPQTLVAEAIGVSERAYQTWEAGEARPVYRNLERLAAYYGVTEDFILTGRVGDGSSGGFHEAQLTRIEAKLDELLRRMPGDQQDLGTYIAEAVRRGLRGEDPPSAEGRGR